ncbi:DNA repair protein RecO [Solimonas marina]|uniref:DNA repair protein RecO n=1 Tax=Solimonas marina TaxID=2714601 RepID=A0A970B3Z6_9GAMM|nr:DNA repair protein RecO [Solimonas marina]NKF21802.1 DNA repair protein RecO [Solimonas marina]
MRERVTLEPAYLLNRRPYQDSSLLLEAYTRQYGRVGLVARGARGPKSKLRGVLQPFTPLLLGWAGGGDLGTLQGAEAVGPPLPLSGERVFFGWYLNELLIRLVARADPHPPLFEAYALALQQLPDDAELAQDALRIFEKTLLAELGYGLLLPDGIDPQAHYRYDGERGARPVPGPEPGSYAGASLAALRDEHFANASERGDARRLLRDAIAPLLGGRSLETPRLLREMRSKADKIPDS